MPEISKVEEIDSNLSTIIEGLPEGKLLEIAKETKRKYWDVQHVLFEIDDLTDKIKEKLKEVL